ncbi:MAG: recombination-associated protein RdgC [Mailhella sp.]|nr:recombination-associated protein RdgC [Mailhella sp.]
MGFDRSTTSFTRFRVLDAIPSGMDFEARLKRFAFIDIDDIAEERSFGWTNFDDMLDTEWKVSPPQKADYLTFSLRLDSRRISPAVFKKYYRLAIQAEEKAMAEQGKKFIPKDRRKEIREQVKFSLLAKTLPIPAEFQVVWQITGNLLYLASTQSKVIELFTDLFTRTFDLSLEEMLPYSLASSLLGDGCEAALDSLEATSFS